MSLINIQLKYSPINKAVAIPLDEIDHDIDTLEHVLQLLHHARREHINYHNKNKRYDKETDKEILSQVEANQNGAVSRQ
ncbi:hypothetical protein ACNGTO_03345 [Bisgaard Taxon 45]